VRGRGGDKGAVGDGHGLTGGLDEPAIAAMGGAGVERAADRGDAALGVGQEADHAILVTESLGLDDACIVHRRGHQGVGGLSRHDDAAAIGEDQTAIFGESLQSAGVHRNTQQAIARQIERDAIPRC